MVVQEQTLYASVAGIAFVATLVATVYLRRYDGNTRRHMVAAPITLGLLTLGYAGMALDVLAATTPNGEPAYLTRFAVYTLTYTFLMSYIGLVGGARRRYRLLPGIAVLGFTYGTLVVQLAPPPLDSVGSLLVLASLATVLWAFFRPLSRRAAAVSGQRRLLFAKLRNLASLIFISYLILALTTRQALGLLDAFVGVFIAAYVDLLAHLGLAGLVLYSGNAVEEVASLQPSPLGTFTEGDSDAAESDDDPEKRE